MDGARGDLSRAGKRRRLGADPSLFADNVEGVLARSDKNLTDIGHDASGTEDVEKEEDYIPAVLPNLALCTYTSVRHMKGTWKLRANKAVVIVDGKDMVFNDLHGSFQFYGA